MLQIEILTIFPGIFNSYFTESILKRAQKKKVVKITIHDFRRFATDKHTTVDDRPYGGGPGMVLKVEPIYRCLRSIPKKKKSRVILLTPKGKTFSQKKAQTLATYNQLILIAGHYEGFDERIRKYADEELSIGNYVLTGGEAAAIVVVDAITRLLPGALGDDLSPMDETFSKNPRYVEYPHYTRPENFKGKKVPAVLLSGNHKKIRAWRDKMGKTHPY
ncbi:MAG: tRNA (guanosine(37)-N1)-methyltransferase TrmD [Patescibacteria group bacterium]